MSTTDRLRSGQVQDHHARAVAGRGRGLASLGAVPRRVAGTATETMLDLARVGPGCRVLDVAAGAGEQSLAAARRVGPAATCWPPTSRRRCSSTPRATRAPAGLANVATRELDGEALDTLPAASVRRRDLARRPDLLSRPAARAGRHDARAEAGRARRGDRLFDARAQRLLLDPGDDHPAARATAAAAARPAGPVLARAATACSRPRCESGLARHRGAQRSTSPVRLPTAAECVRFERESFGALHQMMAGMSEAERAETWQEIEEALARFETGAASSALARCWSAPPSSSAGPLPRHLGRLAMGARRRETVQDRAVPGHDRRDLALDGAEVAPGPEVAHAARRRRPISASVPGCACPAASAGAAAGRAWTANRTLSRPRAAVERRRRRARRMARNRTAPAGSAISTGTARARRCRSGPARPATVIGLPPGARLGRDLAPAGDGLRAGQIRQAPLAAVLHHEPRLGPERVVPAGAVRAALGHQHQARSSADVHVDGTPRPAWRA